MDCAATVISLLHERVRNDESGIFYPRAGKKKKVLVLSSLNERSTYTVFCFGNTSMFAKHEINHGPPKVLPFPSHESKSGLTLGNFQLATDYNTETPPWYVFLEQVVDKLKKKPAIAQLNFIREIETLLPFDPQKDQDKLFHALLDTALHLLSLRQEMTGEQNTIQVVNPFVWDTHSKNFDLLCKELEQKFLSFFKKVPFSHRSAYQQEINQVLKRIRTLGVFLQPIDFSQPKSAIESQMRFLGFTQQEFSVTPALIRHFPSIRNTITSIPQLAQILEGKSTVRLWVGPRSLTGSPPHWLHSQGKSTFLWLGDLVVSLENDVPEAAVLERGKFSHSPLPTLLRALSVNQSESKQFNSRAEILEFINIFTDVAHIPGSVFLDYIIQLAGDFVPAPAFDSQIQLGKLPLVEFMEEIEKIFQFEWQRCVEDKRYEKGLEGRLFVFAEQVKQLMADNSTQGLPEIVHAYQTKAFSTLQASQLPLGQIRVLKNIGLQVNPTTFSKTFDWSLIDCVAGTPGSLVQQVGKIASVDGVNQLHQFMGKERYDLLSSIEGKSISDRAEFVQICRQFGKDPSKFPEENWGKCVCRHCEATKKGLSNYLGPCGWCLSCELKDDYGILGPLPSLVETPEELLEEDSQQSSTQPIGISSFVAGLANPQLYKKVFLIQTLLEQQPKKKILPFPTPSYAIIPSESKSKKSIPLRN